MKLEFVTKPDAIGLGRVVVDNKYYGLPVEIIQLFQRLKEAHELSTPSQP